jgi:uncharacterized protein (DUF433 family)
MENRITILPDFCNGKPTIRGMGVTVATVIEFLLAGDSWNDILENYPFLETADIEACVEYTLGMVNHKHTIKPIAA